MIIFIFQLTPELSCIEVELYQDIIVTNLYPVMKVEISSLLSGELYNSTVVRVPVQNQDICQLCASHACKQCANIINNSLNLKSSLLIIITALILLNSNLNALLI